MALNELIETMARAIKSSIGEQLNAAPIHPDPSVGDWAADGGEINIDQVARAALRASIGPIMEIAARDAISFLVGDPMNGVPLRNPMAHEVADHIRALAAEMQEKLK